MSTDNERRKIAHIRIRDVLAIEEFEMNLDGDGLAISGRMATGKTSILDGLSAAFGKANRAEMLRQGTERGELLIVLDDGHQITREVTADGLSKPVVRAPDGELVKRPADFLSKLAPALALNPVEFIQASEARQIRMLADAFPVPVTLDDLRKVVGDDLSLVALEDRADLAGLDLVMAGVRHASTELRNAKLLAEKVESQANALRNTIPQGFSPESIRGISSADLATELGQIHQHNRVVAETREKLGKIEKQKSEVLSKAQQVQQQIYNLQQELESLQGKSKGLDKAHEDLQVWLESNPPADSSHLEERLSTLDQQRAVLSNYDRAIELQRDADHLRENEARFSRAKKRLSNYPSTLTERAEIPISGLSIEDDRILVNGLPISNLSDGERLRLAIQVATAGAGELGIVCIDGAERMSESEREALLGSLEEKGMQFFVTEVSDGDLAITRRVRAEPAVDVTQAQPDAESEPEAVVEPASVELTEQSAVESVQLIADEAAEASRKEKTPTELLAELFAEANIRSPLVSAGSLVRPSAAQEIVTDEPAHGATAVATSDIEDMPGFDEAPTAEAADDDLDDMPGFGDESDVIVDGLEMQVPGFDDDLADSMQAESTPVSQPVIASKPEYEFQF